MTLTPQQQRALRLAILECRSEAQKYPDNVELAETVEELKPVLDLLYRAKSVTVEV